MQNGSHGEKEKSRESKPKIRWLELKETSCQEAFRQEVTRTLGGKDGLLGEWDKTVEMHTKKNSGNYAGNDIWEMKRRQGDMVVE